VTTDGRTAGRENGRGRVGERESGRRRICHRLAWMAALSAVLPFSGPPVVLGQVTISPPSTHPAAWERFAVRVFGAGDTSIVGVDVDVPEAVTILGVHPLIGWQYSIVPATDTTPQSVAWAGGPLAGLDFDEFAILGRVMADARRRELVFPVHITLAGGEVLHFAGSAGASRPAPRVRIVERTQLSPRGAMAAAAVAVALSAVALALTLSRRRTDDTSPGGTSR
jgi:hypothetical protein